MRKIVLAKNDFRDEWKPIPFNPTLQQVREQFEAFRMLCRTMNTRNGMVWEVVGQGNVEWVYSLEMKRNFRNNGVKIKFHEKD